VDNTDDRMGELNMNNVHWSRMTRRMTSASMISSGWVYGTVRQTLAALGIRLRSGGGGFTAEFNPTAMLNLASMVAISAGVNALYQFVKTGSMPGSKADFLTPLPVSIAKDLIAPRTGGTTKGGAPARALLPGEEKEFYDWGKIVATTYARANSRHGGWGPGVATALSGSADYAEAKLVGPLRIIQTLATGVDPVGRNVAYTPDGLARWLLGAVMPIAINNWEGVRPKSHISAFESLAGAREMPDWISDPLRFNSIQNYLTTKWWREEMRRERSIRSWATP
jgi:hypothetical protein